MTYLDAVQELRDAGAEAISVDGERVVATTAIVDTPDGISVGGTVLSSPVEIRAIGDPDTLATGLSFPGGVLESVREAGAEGIVVERDVVEIDGGRVSAEAAAPGLGSAALDARVPTARRPTTRRHGGCGVPRGPEVHDRPRVGAGPVRATTVRFGITDYAQDALGDIVYVSLPDVGAAVAPGTPAARSSRPRA